MGTSGLKTVSFPPEGKESMKSPPLMEPIVGENRMEDPISPSDNPQSESSSGQFRPKLLPANRARPPFRAPMPWRAPMHLRAPILPQTSAPVRTLASVPRPPLVEAPPDCLRALPIRLDPPLSHSRASTRSDPPLARAPTVSDLLPPHFRAMPPHSRAPPSLAN